MKNIIIILIILVIASCGKKEQAAEPDYVASVGAYKAPVLTLDGYYMSMKEAIDFDEKVVSLNHCIKGSYEPKSMCLLSVKCHYEFEQYENRLELYLVNKTSHGIFFFGNAPEHECIEYLEKNIEGTSSISILFNGSELVKTKK